MSRSLRREWTNGRGGNWSCRIRWYAKGQSLLGGEDIRLQIEDLEYKKNVYPINQEKAEQVWQLFRQGCLPYGQGGVIVADLLRLIRGRDLIKEDTEHESG